MNFRYFSLYFDIQDTKLRTMEYAPENEFHGKRTHYPEIRCLISKELNTSLTKL